MRMLTNLLLVDSRLKSGSLVGDVDGGELVLGLEPRSLALGIADVAVNQAGMNWDCGEVTLTLTLVRGWGRVLDLDWVRVLRSRPELGESSIVLNL